jgi:hypothetical protein
MGMFDWLFGGAKKSTGPQCVACDSTDVLVLGPDAYRCGCGYEGGEGYAAYQRAQRQDAFRALGVEDLTARVIEVLEDGRFRLASVGRINGFERGASWSEVSITFTLGTGMSMGGMGGAIAQQDREEAERRRIERDVAGTFVHQQVLEAASIVEVLMEKGEDHLALALEASRASSPSIEKSGPALMEMGKLIVG